MNNNRVSYQIGIPEKYRAAAAGLYDEAFGKKFSAAIKSREDRLRLFTRGMSLQYAIGASTDQDLLGVAGFHSTSGSLTGGIHFRDLLSQLGVLKGVRAALIFSLYERKPQAGELVMDGIAVRSDARGMGIGGRLLNEIQSYARHNGYNRVRLDVIDTNPKAKSLYERRGFKPVATEDFPHLKRILGFGGVTTMELSVDDDS